ncbi:MULTISPECIES: SulP family inorganic anion transporter [Bradyrhizobium]|jgi:MFS superfamily sulfate permease-like transporter|uniref:SulP family inorganic anion transporter n=2 Tax=Bradyrhizobium TaxID=374 RepID=A0ABS5GEG6_9BRAD|nr:MULTISPECIES: SulP family inorganic anion transporter [Bradyrhizobium]MBR1139731.1 SulP family inorganic anion transporter [Bradyrhizobium denitrificans]MDU1491392.1 SulP family inorganic anion transporter [Bradyrhizobium sp.]MDU1541570.1 SulP family inorganic anion transporter [Bradyrhizobium sp.]MDU1668821.1 SulP family inorganic anion transporter [Bradyrhizobium sp.]MDU1804145.1 SulP family inorganic anion transporter [Bradyrhizobium sp.]
MTLSTRNEDGQHWPLLRSLAGWRISSVPADLAAGLTLAAIAIPEQMATAKLGGFTPETGFFAFMAGSLGFALFGANRFLSCGADSTITPIFAAGLALLAATGTPEYGSLAAALALLVGVLLVLAGGFRLGGIANLLSVPVTVGFLAGIAVHIIVSQLPSVLGLPSPGGPTLARIAGLAGGLGKTNIHTLIIGFGVLATVMVCERISARIPGALIALVASTLYVASAGLEAKGVHVIGEISGTIPMPSMPLIGAEQWAKLVPLAFLIAVVVMVQTSATTRSFPSAPDHPADVDRDFLGAGAGSLLAGLFGAFPVNASPPRTGIVVETGGRSQVAGLLAAIIVLLLVLFGARLLAHVPEAALGGVLLFVAQRIIRVAQIARVYRASKGEFLLIMATAAAIVVLPIEQGVALGITLSLLHGIWSTTRAHLITFERVPDTTIWWPAHPHIRGEQLSDIAVIGFQAPLSFLNAATFRADLQHLLQRRSPRLLVLEASAMVEIDYTAAQALHEVIEQCNKDGIVFAVARLESLRAQEAFERFGLYDVLPRDRVFRSVDLALRKLRGTTG